MKKILFVAGATAMFVGMIIVPFAINATNSTMLDCGMATMGVGFFCAMIGEPV